MSKTSPIRHQGDSVSLEEVRFQSHQQDRVAVQKSALHSIGSAPGELGLSWRERCFAVLNKTSRPAAGLS